MPRNRKETPNEEYHRLFRAAFPSGYNRDGYNVDGRNRDGMSRENYHRYAFIQEQEELVQQRANALALSATRLNMANNEFNFSDPMGVQPQVLPVGVQEGDIQGSDGKWYRYNKDRGGGGWVNLYDDDGVSFYSDWRNLYGPSERYPRGKGAIGSSAPRNSHVQRGIGATGSPGGRAERRNSRGKGKGNGQNSRGKGKGKGKGNGQNLFPVGTGTRKSYGKGKGKGNR
jgi:hypothetical protein